MDNKAILRMLKSSGIPVAYGAFRTAQNPPYIEYSLAYTSNLFGDSKVCHIGNHWQVNLFTLGKSSATERQLEAVLDMNEICWDKISGNLDDEGYLQTIYEFGEAEADG